MSTLGKIFLIHASLFLALILSTFIATAQTVTITVPAQTIQVEVPDTPLPVHTHTQQPPLVHTHVQQPPLEHAHALPTHEHALPVHIHEYAPVPPVVDPADPLVGQAHLTWTMPTTRVDGSPLAPAEIAGYKIYYDCTNGYANMIDTINYANPLALEYTTNTMPVGETCGFEIVTYDTNGLESVRSNRVEKLIQ